MNTIVVGAGFVGMANALTLAQHNCVTVVDIDSDRVAMLNAGKPPVDDKDAASFLAQQPLDLKATTQLDTVINEAELVIIATPTNYDPDSNFFDTSSVESVIAHCASLNPQAVLVVKSTVPVGFCQRIINKFPQVKLVFSPEFLREGTALADNLSPSRVVVGGAEEHIEVYLAANTPCLRNDPPVLTMAHTEAEAVKLFANTYLAMRVAFFNELDSYALHHVLDTRKIIEGVSLDPRVGEGYNNPSFGYGGYCLPKDSKQLLANYFNVPNNLIKAVVEANDTRKNFIVENIINRQPRSVGIYRLVMKAGSDNYRESSISSIVSRLVVRGIDVVVFEPMLAKDTFLGAKVVTAFDEFVAGSDLIVANRIDARIEPFTDKVFTRDLFGDN